MDDDDPEKRIRELERGVSDQPPPQDYRPPQDAWTPPPPPPPSGWAGYQPTNQPWSAAPQVVKRSGIRWVWLAVALGAIGPVIAGLIMFADTTSGPFSSAPELHTADGLTGLVTSIRDHFGDTDGYELVVYPDYAIIDRPMPTNEHAQQSYMYRGDEWEEWSTPSSVSSFDEVADLSEFDAAGVSAVIANAAQLLDIHDATSTYLIIRGGDIGNLIRKESAETDLTLYVHVSAPASGMIEIDPDGGVVELHPPGG